jgi:hypothetical protein
MANTMPVKPLGVLVIDQPHHTYYTISISPQVFIYKSYPLPFL